MEKIVTEYRVIETDDGFRIEIKGDKEKIRSFVENHGFPKRRVWRHRPHPGFGWGPWGTGSMMWETMSNCWDRGEEKSEN